MFEKLKSALEFELRELARTLMPIIDSPIAIILFYAFLILIAWWILAED